MFARQVKLIEGVKRDVIAKAIAALVGVLGMCASVIKCADGATCVASFYDGMSFSCERW